MMYKTALLTFLSSTVMHTRKIMQKIFPLNIRFKLSPPLSLACKSQQTDSGGEDNFIRFSITYGLAKTNHLKR